MKLWLLVCWLVLPAALALGEQADLVLKNGAIITMESDQPRAQAVAVKGDRIVWVGDAGSAASWIGKSTRVIDLQGAFVYPGFIESHAHIQSLGDSRMMIELVGTPDKSAVVELVRARVARTAKGDWIRGHGWDQNDWPVKEFPTASDLDAVSPNNPVVLGRVDGHACWVNSRALQVAGITAQTKDPDGGKILRDKSGNPTGVFVDNAMELVLSKMKSLTLEESIQRVRLALKEASQKGITLINDAGSGNSGSRDLDAFKALAAKDELPVRIFSMAWMPSKAGEDLLKTGPQNYGPYLDERSIKMILDGALGSRGAALLQPYSDDPGNQGLLMWKEPDLIDVLRRAKEKGLQVGIHAIGDRANRMVLDAYEKTGVRGLRWRIEHAQVIAPSDIARFAALDVIASMQPIHATSDGPWATDRLGPDRVKGAYAWRSLLDAHTTIAGGSDAPVEDINPLWGIYAAITRQDHSGKPEGGWHPEQLVTREEALRMYTAAGAFTAFHEKDLGSIKTGKLADFTILPENLLTCDPKSMITMKVLYTIVGGRVRYAAEPAAKTSK